MFLAALLLGGCSTTARAAPDLQLTQYSHFAWRLQDGYFNGSPNAITQTPDGYLWVGTDNGLQRFDGASFVPWSSGQPESKRLFGIQKLVAAPDGTLWIGALTGLAQLRNGRLTNFTKTRVNGVVVARDGTVWFATSEKQDRAGFCSMVVGTNAIRCFGIAEGYVCPIGQSASLDRAGGVWIGCNASVLRWSKDSATSYAPVDTTRMSDNTDRPPMDTLDLGDGRMLIGYASKGPHFGLQEFGSGRWQSFNPKGLQGEKLVVTRLLMDRRGGIWIGTTGQGLYHVVDGKADHYGSADGLSGDDIASIYEDREGSVWVATQAGVDRFHPLKMVSLSTRQGMISDYAQGVASGPKGTVAAALTGGLNLIDGNHIASIYSGHQLPGYIAVNTLIDHTGTVWASTDLQVGRLRGGVWQPIGGQQFDRAEIIEDPQHEIVVKSYPDIFRVDQGKSVKIAGPLPPSASSLVTDPRDGFWVIGQHGFILRYQDHISHVLAKDRPNVHLNGAFVGADGRPWGWGLNGLLFWNDHDWLTLTTANGLPCDAIYTAIDDEAGSLWVYGRCGVAVIPKSDLDALARDQSKKVNARLLIDTSEGANGGFGDFRTKSVRSPDGLLWFAWGGELQYIDPKNVPVNRMSPPVHIEHIVANHRTLPRSDDFSLPALTRNLEIDYSALSLVAPQKVRFRYRLSGVDSDWQEVGNRRQAFYMNLPPGHYVFQVIACNNDGVWNLTGDSIRLVIAPAFYQTTWFRLLMIALLLAILWMAYLLRLRYATRQLESRLLERFSERERIARELHDTLLQGFQAVVWNFQGSIHGMSKDNPVRHALERAIVRAETALAAGRQRVRDLRSKTSRFAGLEDEVNVLVEELRQEYGASIELKIHGTSRALNELVQEEMLAIIQEALINSLRHAKASRVVCEIDFDPAKFSVICRDDGIGIPAQVLGSGSKEGHYGLVGMRERAQKIAASLDIRRDEPSGTLVELTARARVAYRQNRAA